MTTRRDRERMIAEGTTTVDAELAAVENKLAQAIRERDEARREILLWVKERCSWVELTAEIKTRGWEYLKETYK